MPCRTESFMSNTANAHTHGHNQQLHAGRIRPSPMALILPELGSSWDHHSGDVLSPEYACTRSNLIQRPGSDRAAEQSHHPAISDDLPCYDDHHGILDPGWRVLRIQGLYDMIVAITVGLVGLGISASAFRRPARGDRRCPGQPFTGSRRQRQGLPLSAQRDNGLYCGMTGLPSFNAAISGFGCRSCPRASWLKDPLPRKACPAIP